jgi:hypothetical protein
MPLSPLVKLTNMIPKPKQAKDELSQSLKDFVKAQDEWLSYGQTTICDGRSMGVSWPVKGSSFEKSFKG